MELVLDFGSIQVASLFHGKDLKIPKILISYLQEGFNTVSFHFTEPFLRGVMLAIYISVFFFFVCNVMYRYGIPPKLGEKG